MNPPNKCPVCPGKLEITELSCKQCHTSIRGNFELSGLATLTGDETEILKTFLGSVGSIKEVQDTHKMSYQTANTKIKSIINKIGITSEGGHLSVGPNQIDNPHYLAIQRVIESFPNIEPKNCDTMIGYYGLASYGGRRKKGFVWVEYPYQSSRLFKVHLMKERGFAYPVELIDSLGSNYKKDGWGHYPEFFIRNSKDAEVAIELIKIAFNNL